MRQLRAGEVAGAVELASLAAAGCHTSQFYLGQAYQFGRTVEKDLLKAKQLYRQAARAGHSEAKHNLALLELSSREHSATHEPAGRVGEVKAERNSLSRGQAENLYRLVELINVERCCTDKSVRVQFSTIMIFLNPILLAPCG